MNNCKDLNEVRENIDRIDNQIVKLIAERSCYVKQAANFKKTTDDVKAPKRVEMIIEKVRKLADNNNVNPDIVEVVYRSMISSFINFELKEFGQTNLEDLKGNKDVLKSMIDYLYIDFETDELNDIENDVGYTQEDIDDCSRILDKYVGSLIAINEPKSNDKIIECVKDVIENLNELNERCDFCIIETDPREGLVPYIIKCAELAGLVTDEYDITERWREW